MPSVEEMATWAPDEIMAHIQRLLPEGHEFGLGRQGIALWLARVVNSSGDKLWERSGMDERVLLLDAYGWLWLQRQAAPAPDTPWARRPSPKLQQVSRSPSTDPDPEDLDPAEVLAVYGFGPKRT